MKQPMPYLFDTKKRIIVITGHYGSGKTEFAVNLALALKNDEMHCPFKEVSLVDLDVANPYFRSGNVRKFWRPAGFRYSEVRTGEKSQQSFPLCPHPSGRL